MTERDQARQSVSIRDVAKAAGVSPITVSRVINGSPSVREATAKRVRVTMDRLGYRPNLIASALKNGRTRNIGVILRTDLASGNAKIIEGLSVAAMQQKYVLTLATLFDNNPHSLCEVIERMESIGVEGLVVQNDDREFHLNELANLKNIPLVFVGSGNGLTNVDTVSVDNAKGARIAVEHLIAAGHRRIFHVSGPLGSESTYERMGEWRNILLRHGLDVPDPMHAANWSSEDGYEIGKAFIETVHSCTAIFAANDAIALGIMFALREGGVRVPQDVSIVGFDDIDYSRMPGFSFDTIRQNYMQIGSVAIKQIIDHLQNEQHSSLSIKIDPELVEHGSVASPNQSRYQQR